MSLLHGCSHTIVWCQMQAVSVRCRRLCLVRSDGIVPPCKESRGRKERRRAVPLMRLHSLQSEHEREASEIAVHANDDGDRAVGVAQRLLLVLLRDRGSRRRSLSCGKRDSHREIPEIQIRWRMGRSNLPACPRNRLPRSPGVLGITDER